MYGFNDYHGINCFCTFGYRKKKYVEYKVRVIMRYYWDEMKCNK